MKTKNSLISLDSDRSELERIHAYIKKTDFQGKERYGITFLELRTISKELRESPAEMISLAFEYGRAKGYRAARREAAR